MSWYRRSSGFYISKEDIRNSPLTLGLIGLNVILFIILNIIFKFFLHNQNLLIFLAQNNFNIAQGIEIWSLFTSMFVHWDIMHLFFNMLALFLFGLAGEKIYRWWQYLLIYFLSGFLGSLFTFLLLPIFSIGAGASGAIYGLIVAVILKIWKSDPMYYLFAGIYLAIRLIDGNFAHLFGALGGLLIGLLIKWYENRRFVKNHTKNYTRRKKISKFSTLFNKLRKKQRKSSPKPTFSPKLSKFGRKINPGKFSSGEDYEISLLQKIRDILIVDNILTLDRAAYLMGMKSKDLLPRIKIWEKKFAFHLELDLIYVDDPTQLVFQIDQILDQWEMQR
jgi:membrane associated rhomboid family serine protease